MTAPTSVLVTGGAGFIGSTVASALADAGHRPIVLDDLSSGRPEFLRGRDAYVGDIADRALLRRVLREHPEVTTVVHCAARVVVPESVSEPAAYYRTNVAGTLALAESMLDCGVTRLVFSGSAAIYAPGPDRGVDESSPWAPQSPYARTKAVAETLLADLAAATPLRVLSLRYFNPVGADPALRTGPYQRDPSHVLGRLLTAERTGRPFTLTGVDYPTVDGTAVRDYVHVWDLARAHVAAIERLDRAVESAPHTAVDLGTGRGTTVRQLIATFERVTGRPLPVVEAPRRAGDNAGAFTRSSRAWRLLGWRPELSLARGIHDVRAWARIRRPDREAS